MGDMKDNLKGVKNKVDQDIKSENARVHQDMDNLKAEAKKMNQGMKDEGAKAKADMQKVGAKAQQAGEQVKADYRDARTDMAGGMEKMASKIEDHANKVKNANKPK